MPNAGKLFTTPVYEWFLTNSVSSTVSASGVENLVDKTGGASSLESVYDTPFGPDLGVKMVVSSTQDGPTSYWSLEVPFMGIALAGGNSSYLAGLTSRFRLLDVVQYATLYTQPRLVWSGWEWEVGGSVIASGGGGEFTADYLISSWMPPFGESCVLNSASAGGVSYDDPVDKTRHGGDFFFGASYDIHTGEVIEYLLGPGLRYLPYSVETTIAVTASGGFRYKDDDGDWQDMPVDFAPVGYVSGITAARTSTSSVTNTLRHKEYRIIDSGLVIRHDDFGNYQWAYAGHELYETEENVSSLWLWPGGEQKIERMQGGHAEVALRFGLPGSEGTATTSHSDDADIDDATYTTDVQTVLPVRNVALGVLRDGLHAIEDVLQDGNPSPYSSAHNLARGQKQDVGDNCGVFDGIRDPDHYGLPADGWPYYSPCAARPPFQFTVADGEGSEYPTSVTLSGQEPGLFVSSDPQMTLWNCRSAALALFGDWFPNNVGGDEEDPGSQEQWPIDGGPVPNQAWKGRRMQWEHQASFPPTDGTDRLTDLVSNVVDESGHTPHIDAFYGENVRPLGISRFDVMEISPAATGPSEHCPLALELRPDSEGSFGSDDCTMTFDADGIHVTPLDPDQSTATIVLRLNGWAAPPCLYPMVSESVTVGFTGDATGLSVSLVSALGGVLAGNPIADGGTVPFPRLDDPGYAGTWGAPKGAGYTIDTGSDEAPGGQSGDTMIDPGRVHTFGAFRARGLERLVLTLNLTKPTDEEPEPDNVLRYPKFTKCRGSTLVVQETGSEASILYADGPAVRFGNWLFFDPIEGFQNPPIVAYPGYKSTIVDAICWRRAVMQGVSPLDGGVTGLTSSPETIPPLTDELYARFDAYEGQSIAVADKFSIAFPLPTTDGTVRIALVNTMQEILPLALMPQRKRNPTTWKPTGAYARDVYSLCKEPRDVISPVSPLTVEDPDGNLVSSPVGAIDGWKIERYSPVVTNDEPTEWRLVQAGTLVAKIRPWHGEIWAGKVGEDGSVRLAIDDLKGFFLEVRSSGSNVHAIAFRLSGQTFEGDVSDGNNGAPWVRGDGTYCVAFARGGSIYAKYSYDNGTTWSGEEMIGPGTLCDADRDPIHGWDGVPVWSSGDWRFYLKRRKANPDDETWEDRGLIVTAPEKAAGFRFDVSSEGAAVFTYSSGSGVQRLATFDYGTHWESLT